MMRFLVVLLLSQLVTQAATHVVAVGVETYDDKGITALKFAEADAAAVVARFRAAGARPEDVVVLTSSATAPEQRSTRLNVLRALSAVRQRAQAGDRVVLFFAGHGVERDGEQYLLTVDTARELMEDTSLPIKLVNASLKGVLAAEILVLVDACRNDPDAGRGDEDAALSEGLARGLRPMLAAAVETKPRLNAVLLACGVGQRSWAAPELSHGLFTHALLQALDGQAADAAGKVTLSALVPYVESAVKAEATKLGKEQTPLLVNPDGGDMEVLTVRSEPVVSIAAVNVPLGEMVAQLQRDYGVEVILTPGVGADENVTGRLRDVPLTEALNLLLIALDLGATKDGAVYRIGLRIPPLPEGVEPVTAPDFPAPLVFNGPTITVSPQGRLNSVAMAAQLAAPGTTIKVKPGTYEGTVVVDKPLAIVGDGPREQIVLTATDASVIQANQPCRVEGLTVRQRDGGTTLPAGSSTGLASQGRFELQDCTVDTSRAASAGTAISIYGSGRVRGTTVISKGWGLAALPGADLVMDDCTLQGCALEFKAPRSAVIRNVSIVSPPKWGVVTALWGFEDRQPDRSAVIRLQNITVTGARTAVEIMGGHHVLLSGSKLAGNGVAVNVSDGSSIEVRASDLTGYGATPVQAEDGCKVTLAADNRVDAPEPWEKLPLFDESATGRRVRIDEAGRFVVDDRPVLPLVARVWWASPPKLAAIAAAGFNAVLPAATWHGMTPPDAKKVYDSVSAAGLMLVGELWKTHLPQPDPIMTDVVRSVLPAHGNHPAWLCAHLGWQPTSAAERFHRLQVTLASGAQWPLGFGDQGWNSVQGRVMQQTFWGPTIDCHPQRGALQLLRHSDTPRPRYTATMPELGLTPVAEPLTPTAYPNESSLRSLLFQAMIAGSNGLVLDIGTFTTGKETPGRGEAVSAVVKELGTLSSYLLSVQDASGVSLRSSDVDLVFARAWYSGGQYLILVANDSPDKVGRLEWKLPPRADRPQALYGETKTLTSNLVVLPPDGAAAILVKG